MKDLSHAACAALYEALHKALHPCIGVEAGAQRACLLQRRIGDGPSLMREYGEHLAH